MSELGWDEAAALVRRHRGWGWAASSRRRRGGRRRRGLVPFGRREEGMLATMQLAMGEACTACSMQRPTQTLHERAWSGGDLFGLGWSTTPARRT
jgi:hypothetical protein